jgi:Tfp pilus assembly protein FimT
MAKHDGYTGSWSLLEIVIVVVLLALMGLMAWKSAYLN